MTFSEKRIQIQLMGNIYKRAVKCVAWIGESSHLFDRTIAASTCKKLEKCESGVLATMPTSMLKLNDPAVLKGRAAEKDLAPCLFVYAGLQGIFRGLGLDVSGWFRKVCFWIMSSSKR